MLPFEGKSVLVTGAGGSIGSELCRRIVASRAKKLTLVSLTEAGLYNIDRRLRKEFREPDRTTLNPVLGSVVDEAHMREVLAGVDIVVHAAAHKHVPICEANPIAAIKNNAMATWSLIYHAARARVDQFVLISTDKAVNPASVMGATKRLAELLLYEAAGRSSTRFCTVRFGNVMNSAGSVLPLWKEQIEAGGPLTLTDPRCERFFMTIERAVDLVTEVVGMRPQWGTFVPDMGPPLRLFDLAQQLIAESGKPCDITTIGLRPGEKLTEELSYGGTPFPTEVAGVYRVSEPARESIDMRILKDLFRHVKARNRSDALLLLWSLVK